MHRAYPLCFSKTLQSIAKFRKKWILEWTVTEGLKGIFGAPPVVESTLDPVAALLVDLKRRGLLEDTLVVWAGEMGRTPHTPAVTPECGRDHHVDGYTMFLAGGGFRGGIVHGETDEFGNSVVADAVDIHDIHASILERLGYRVVTARDAEEALHHSRGGEAIDLLCLLAERLDHAHADDALLGLRRDVRERLLETGGEPYSSSIAEFRKTIEIEAVRWRKVVQENNIKGEE